MAQTRLAKGLVGVLVLAVIFGAHGIAAAAEPAGSKTSDGLTVYFGVVPAELVKGPPPHSTERPMHGRIPRDPREYHVVAAVFDAVTGARVSDVSVTAKVSGLGLSGTNKRLEAMEIAGTTTYGAFFNLPGRDLYTVRLAIERPGLARQVVVDFKYDLRR